MRVLLLDQYSDCGGGQRMLLESLRAIRQRGWSALAALPGDGPLFEQVARLGFPTARIECGPYSSGRKSAADSLRFARDLPRLARQIAELAGRFAPDVLYINGPRLLPAAAFARLPSPVLFHAHTAVPSPMQRWLVGIALREVNAQVVAVSSSVAEFWRPFARVTVIHNAVPEASVPPQPRLEGPPRIGCIGRISPEKGQREFLRAAARILEAIPGARFFVYGAALFGDAAAGRYEKEIRAAAEGLPVEFPGWVDDVYGAFAHLDLLLVPSVWQEPNALVILEAFAAGVPAIAFRTGGIPEFLDQLCDTPEEMARMAIDVLSNRERYWALVQVGRRSWKQNFHPDRYRRQITNAMLGVNSLTLCPSSRHMVGM
jgi:glycosyltransferase involved in cell wall biosynthesis